MAKGESGEERNLLWSLLWISSSSLLVVELLDIHTNDYQEEKMEEEKWKENIWSEFTTKEEFVKEAERVFTSLKSRNPFSLGVDMGHYLGSLVVDVQWRINPSDGCDWSLSEVELVLSVLASRQTPNVTETQLDLRSNKFGDISAEVWNLCSKLNNLIYLDLGYNKMRVISPLVCDLVHLQQLHLDMNPISAEGVVGLCELLKVCCSIVCWSIVFDILSG